MKRIPVLFTVLCLAISLAAGAVYADEKTTGDEQIPVKVLILAKFEVDEISGDFPGEAQYYYDAYLKGGAVYEIPSCPENYRLYVRDGVALALTGMGKVNAALATMSILSDERFDFTDACVISTGCAGSARDTTVMGDVFLITSVVDYDLGHHADIREMEHGNGITWFHDDSYDEAACVHLDPDLMDRVYALIADVPLQTTERTRDYMRAAFDGADWAVRDPMVLKGTTVTGDNYWKGEHDHKNALAMVETYNCPDPFVTSEMEEIGIAQAMQRLGMQDRLIILRDSVNMDVFMLGNSPESLWDPDVSASLATEENVEAADIFATAMENNFRVGSVIIDAILNGTLTAEESDAEVRSAASAQEIMDRGVLYVGTTGDYKPMSYLEPDTGEYWGFDIAIAEDLAAALGVEAVYVETSWPTLMEDTLAGKFDLAISGITVTDARKEQALMSEGYFGNGKTVLCRAEDAELYVSLEAINHPEVRVMENPGGLNEQFVRENLPDATLIIHDVNQEIPALVAENEADVMITEIMEAGYYVSRDPRLAAPLIYEPFTRGQLGILMPKGSEDLLAYVNAFITGEKESGRIDELADLYIFSNMQEEPEAAA